MTIEGTNFIDKSKTITLADPRNKTSWLQNMSASSRLQVRKETSLEVQNYFERAQVRFNNAIMLHEEHAHGRMQGVRWLQPKPRALMKICDCFTWGCSCCFNLITSNAFDDVRTESKVKLEKLTLARMASTTKPILTGLKFHASSSIHRLAYDFLFSGGTSLTTIARRLNLPDCSAIHAWRTYVERIWRSLVRDLAHLLWPQACQTNRV